MFKKILLGVGLVISSQCLWASKPFHNTEYQFIQPNGEEITIVLNGNDYFAEQRTLSGKLVIYDEKLGGLAYAKTNKDRTKLLSTGKLVSKKAERSLRANKVNIPQQGLKDSAKRAAAEASRKALLKQNTNQYQLNSESLSSIESTTGNIKGLTIIIQFPDEAGTISKSQVNSYLNDLNYSGFSNASSIRGYFRTVSDNKLDYTNTVTRYYTAQNNKSYYADDNYSAGVRSGELIREALDWLEYTEGFNFSSLTTDSNSRIMGLNIFYAGEADSSWSRGLWPHMGGLSPQFCADGVCTNRYQISNMGSSLSLGVFAHETGHLLPGWPDLYDYDGSSNGSVAGFGLMGVGSVGSYTMKKPVPPNGYFRYLAGWDTVTELNPAVDNNAPQGQLSHTSESNTIYRWTNPGRQNEAFYIENIHKSGQNQYQPDSGLAVWHIDPDGSNSNEWLPYVQMEHADGNRDPEYSRNQGDNSDLYASSSEFGFNAPNSDSSRGTNSRWSNGNDSGLEINNISAPSQTVSFTVGDGSTEPPQGDVYTGSLSDGGSDIVPNGQWFDYYNGGTISLELSGPGNADFDMKLERWNGSSWIEVDRSETPTSEESISYSANAGYYRVNVYSYSGSGSYTLTVNM